MIWDTFRTDERQKVLEAMRSLLPEDSADWSRKGVYGYWDPHTRKLLYLGLANNLPERFAQHNGLVSHSGGNKRKQIDGWFEGHERLGLTILVQAAAVGMLDLMQDISFSIGEESSEIIAVGEGQLIELHRRETGHWPPWNRTSGSRHGAKLATDSGHSLIPILSAARDSLFVSRRSLRDLAQDALARSWEATIHAARMRAVLDAHEVHPFGDIPNVPERIEQSLLAKAGHIINDLSPSDAVIMEWLRRIEDGRANSEARQLRAAIAELGPRMQLAEDRQALALLELIVADADFAEEAVHVTELLASGYLMEKPL